AAGQPAMPGQPGGTLTVTVGEAVPVGPKELRVVGKANINGRDVRQVASVRTPISAGLANLPLPPQWTWTPVGLTVLERPPFRLAVKLDKGEIAPGASAQMTVTATRQPGFAGEIALAVNGLPANVTAAAKPIPADKNEVTFEVKAAANAAPGAASLTVKGT